MPHYTQSQKRSLTLIFLKVVQQHVYYKLTDKHADEGILKIGQYVAKLWTRVQWCRRWTLSVQATVLCTVVQDNSRYFPQRLISSNECTTKWPMPAQHSHALNWSQGWIQSNTNITRNSLHVTTLATFTAHVSTRRSTTCSTKINAHVVPTTMI